MPKMHTYFEKHRIVEESTSKWMKRNLVGIIRFLNDFTGDGQINIPDHYFDDVPDNIGFSIEAEYDEEGNDLRCFQIIDTWETSKDDDGGTEEICDFEDMVFYGVETKEIKKGHLKLVVNNDEKR